MPENCFFCLSSSCLSMASSRVSSLSAVACTLASVLKLTARLKLSRAATHAQHRRALIQGLPS